MLGHLAQNCEAGAEEHQKCSVEAVLMLALALVAGQAGSSGWKRAG
jgi:hypothetical protein